MLWGHELASLTGFAPVISCMRGRNVFWATPQGRKLVSEMVRASGNAPALIYCDAGHKSAGGRVLKPLLELRAQNKFKMQNADFKLLCIHRENPS